MASGSDDYFPNYANRMLTPVNGSDVAPALHIARNRFPLRIKVLNTMYCNKQRFSIVQEATSAWAEATKRMPGGGVSSTCEEVDDAEGADIVVRFCTREETGAFAAFAEERGSYTLIRLAAVDKNFKSIDPKLLKRIAMHEFGHALGIWGHSPDRKDIMSLDPNAVDISLADVNTLRLAYAGKTEAPR